MYLSGQRINNTQHNSRFSVKIKQTTVPVSYIQITDIWSKWKMEPHIKWRLLMKPWYIKRGYIKIVTTFWQLKWLFSKTFDRNYCHYQVLWTNFNNSWRKKLLQIQCYQVKILSKSIIWNTVSRLLKRYQNDAFYSFKNSYCSL